MFIYCYGCLKYVLVEDDDFEYTECPSCGELIRRYEEDQDDE